MGLAIMLVSFGVGAAAIAAWIDIRFPRIGPEELMPLIMHAAGLALLHKVAVPTAFRAAGGDANEKLVALFVVAFPSVTYAMLVGYCMIRIVQRTLSGVR